MIAILRNLFNILKRELIFQYSYGMGDEAKEVIFDYSEAFHNPKRSHSSFGYKSPLDYELKFIISIQLTLKLRNYYRVSSGVVY